MKTTVVHIVATLRDGGAEALLRGLIPRLAAQPGIDLHVVSIYDSRLDEHERRALGAPLHEIGRRGRGDIAFFPRLIAKLHELKPSVVHAHLHTGKYVGRVASIAARVPHIVFTEHGDEAGGLARLAIKRVLNTRTDRFIVFTEAERERYAAGERIARTKIAVIPNGIPAPPATDRSRTRHELGLADDDFAVVVPARLVHQKNQELAVRALAVLRAHGRRNVRLLLIGEGPDAAALRALASELTVEDDVSLLGYRADAIRIIAACDAMALASRWEKMPLVMGEAMLAGTPVISTPWTGIEAFIDDDASGYLSADWTPDAFAAALARAIDDPVKRSAVAAGGRAAALQTFDIARTVHMHADLYRELAAPR